VMLRALTLRLSRVVDAHRVELLVPLAREHRVRVV
jgi:hypothetical protein